MGPFEPSQGFETEAFNKQNRLYQNKADFGKVKRGLLGFIVLKNRHPAEGGNHQVSPNLSKHIE